MPDANAARESNEKRRLVRYTDPNNPTGPMLDRLPTPELPPKPKPNGTKKRAAQEKA